MLHQLFYTTTGTSFGLFSSTSPQKLQSCLLNLVTPDSCFFFFHEEILSQFRLRVSTLSFMGMTHRFFTVVATIVRVSALGSFVFLNVFFVYDMSRIILIETKIQA